MVIALISPPDQCEAAKCYEHLCTEGQPGCPDSDNSAATEVECSQDPPCRYAKYLVLGQVKISRGCNKVNTCLMEKYGFGVGVGCKEQPGSELKKCVKDVYKDGDNAKYCTCSGDLCNREDITTETGGGGSSLKWTVTGAGLMMASIMCVAAAGRL